MTNKINACFMTDSYKIRELCIRERWYECGTIRDYNEILNYVDAHSMLDVDSLDIIATDIYLHSTNKLCHDTREGYIEDIKHIILNDATTICLLG